jgi:hypothetical protein
MLEVLFSEFKLELVLVFVDLGLGEEFYTLLLGFLKLLLLGF